MPRRPTQKTLESLHVTLQKLEQTENSAQDEESISELKRVLLNRIVDLELSKTLETGEPETENKPEPADLIAPQREAEKASPDQVGDPTDTTALAKLD
jgi:hypothetical protein